MPIDQEQHLSVLATEDVLWMALLRQEGDYSIVLIDREGKNPPGSLLRFSGQFKRIQNPSRSRGMRSYLSSLSQSGNFRSLQELWRNEIFLPAFAMEPPRLLILDNKVVHGNLLDANMIGDCVED